MDSPTQSVINGDKTDHSDEIASVKDRGPTNRERSGSRERCLDGENKRCDWSQEAHDRSCRAANYAEIIHTQPHSRNAEHPVPRRHTLGSSRCIADQEGTEKRKEAVMDMLALRYPQYAEKISSTTSEDGFPVRGRTRDPQRRATVGIGYSQSMDYEGRLSEVDGPTFQRGGFVRSSLPVTRRSAPTPVGKPSGLVFLIFRDETKRAILPNEITHLDTVRAMFVRSFPGKLAMQYLESPKRKIYIQEPRTNIYYQLEDLRDIKNGTVLRVHECDSMDPQQVLEKPEVRGRLVQLPPGSHTYYGDTPPSAVTGQVRKAQTLPAYMHQPIYMSHDDVTKSLVVSAYERSRSLTPDPSTSAAHAQNPIYGHMGMLPLERPKIVPQEMTGPQDRAPPVLRSIPENYLMFNGHNKNCLHGDYIDNYQPAMGASPSPGSSHQAHSRQAISPPALPSGPKVDTGRRAFSPPPNLHDHTQVVSRSVAPQGPQQRALLVRDVRTRPTVNPQQVSAPLQSVPAPSKQTPSTPGLPPCAQQNWHDKSPASRRSRPLSTVPHGSLATSAQQRSQSYRVPATSEWDQSLVARPSSTTPSGTTTNRIDKMEHQLANLAAWVQTAVVHTGSSTGAPSSTKSTSIGSSETSPFIDSASSNVDAGWDNGLVQDFTHIASETPVLSQDMKDYIQLIKHQANRLRTDLHSLRRLQQINKECILETVDDAWKKIKDALSLVPGAENLLIHQQRNEVDVLYNIYLEDKAHAEKELADLEHAVEELRSDVLSRQCRVQMSDVEGMALVLSHITKQLGDLKVRFPKLQERLKYVMSAEMELIVKEEKFLNEEPERLDNSLKKCKKLTGTLFTLKRLASVQEHRPPQPVSLSAQAKIPTLDDKKAVLQNILAMVPNHEARIQGIQAAETARLIKKKITSQQEVLKFGNNPELTSKVAIQPNHTAISQSGHVTSGLTTTPQTHPVTSSSTTTSHTGTVSSGFISYTSGITTSSPPLRTELMSQSGISFAMPVSTSSPKTVSQYSVSPQTKSATSLSMSCPIISVIQDSSQKRLLSYSQGDYQKLKVAENIGQGHDQFTSGKIAKSVEFQSEAAKFSGTGSETIEQTLQSTKGDKHFANIDVDFNNQKGAARAAFFSSLSSPPSPTVTASPIACVLSTESPTESLCSSSPSVCVSPIGGRMSAQTRSSLALLSSSSANTSMISPQALYTVGKLESLPVTSTSILSTHSFSPASPSSGTQSSSRPRTAFTAIPKPYSPTKSTPNPITPESQKDRIPLSQHHTNGMSTTSVSASNKAINIIQSRETSEKPKKVPPPPPPRKSSKLPGHAVLAVNVATVNGQLPKHKHVDSKSQQESVCEDLQNFKSANKDLTDIVQPPKQFANADKDTTIESKSSIYSLKQFTTPLLESKRDRKNDQQGKPSELVGKRTSASNLDTGDNENQVKQMDKEIDTNNDKTYKKNELISEGGVTDASEENNDDDDDACEGSIDSNGSSSSLDSQNDVVSVKENVTANTCSVVTHSNISMTGQSAAIISVSTTQGCNVTQNENVVG